MSRASRRLIVSPSPDPSFERVCPFSTCTNGSKIAPSFSRGMPRPVSDTLKQIQGPEPVTFASAGARSDAPHSTCTRPPAGVSLMALLSKFTRICRTRSSSPSNVISQSAGVVDVSVMSCRSAIGSRSVSAPSITRRESPTP